MIHFFRNTLNVGSGILSVLVYVTLIIELIFMLTLSSFQLFYNIHYYMFLLLFLDSVIRLIIRPSRLFGYKRLALGLMAILPILNHNGIHFFVNINLGVQQVLLLIIAFSRIQHLSFLFEPLRSNPTQTFVGGFLLFIFLGAVFFMVPIAHHQPISFIDAVFISASAICVTGLTVFDVGSVFTPFGQMILLILIQIGGLGIMTFYALITISLKERFLSYESKELQDGWSTESMKETFSLVRSIFIITIGVELLGAVAIFFGNSAPVGPLKVQIFNALFHSVSAFCNAGFSLFPNSIAGFSSNPFMISVFSVLIFLGGIGFPVIFEIYHRFIVGDRKRLKLQTKMVIYVSTALIVIGTLVLFLGALVSGKSSPSLLLAFFHAVSARTAGLSMGDISYYSTASLWFIIMLMFIGASPGSTGGGIKTTTFGLLVVAVYSTIKNNARIHIFGRHVKPELVFKALTICLMSIFIVVFSFFVLLFTETIDFFPLLFETVSAVATVGFSLGVTAELSNAGKAIIGFLMFFGRVGPLTLAIALTKRPKPANYKLPDEHVLLG
jgi:trk system potassium uptake protein TrkH